MIFGNRTEHTFARRDEFSCGFSHNRIEPLVGEFKGGGTSGKHRADEQASGDSDELSDSEANDFAEHSSSIRNELTENSSDDCVELFEELSGKSAEPDNWESHDWETLIWRGRDEVVREAFGLHSALKGKASSDRAETSDEALGGSSRVVHEAFDLAGREKLTRTPCGDRDELRKVALGDCHEFANEESGERDEPRQPFAVCTELADEVSCG